MCSCKKPSTGWRNRKALLEIHPELRKITKPSGIKRKHEKKYPDGNFALGNRFRAEPVPVTLAKLDCIDRIDKLLRKP